ncbi:MAG: DegT/DnrJ/EryC1/StrS family aminotransferase [Endozoicomonas sp.]
MLVPMVDMQAWHAPVQDELEQAVVRVLRSGRYVMGKEVRQFEEEVADYLGAKYAISCANGTDALVLALHAAGIGKGDEVLTTGFSFFATVEAIVRVGATPVLVDIDPNTFNIDPRELERSITSRCRAVLIVHLFGLPAPMDLIQEICHSHDLILLEDCAQSFGARYGRQQTGTFGLMGCFSFFPSKNLGGFGDGGLVTTDQQDIADHLEALRNHGSSQQYIHDQVGYNSRLDEIQAALLHVKLKHIERFNDHRRLAAQWYRDFLAGSGVICPDQPSDCHHVYHQFTVVVTQRRDEIKEKLSSAGIASAVYYPLPLHRQKALQTLAQGFELPVCDQLAEHCLSLPIYPGMTEEQVQQVSQALTLIISG